jgi:bifunctional ADP-heptose synthase (sugar kinase/adenylyltransferase)
MIEMDTRAKMIATSEAARLAAEGATVVSGYFDPLLASHARRLAGLKDGARLIVVIEDPPQPILPARARAELVASLRAVDYVVEAHNGIKVDIRLEAEDGKRFEELLTHVHARQRGASQT